MSNIKIRIKLIRHLSTREILWRIKNRFVIIAYLLSSNLKEIEKSVLPIEDLSLITVDSELLYTASREYSEEITPKKKAILKRRLDDPFMKSFFVLNQTNDICGYFHLGLGDVFDSNINYIFKQIDGNVHLFDDYTFIKFRKKGVHSFSILGRQKWAIKMGYKTSTSFVSKGNTASEKAYNKFFFKKKLKIIYIKGIFVNKSIVKPLD